MIEYQKCGLPHMHLTTIIHPDNHPFNADQINQVIQAELPDLTLDSTREFCALIMSSMLHSPCGTVNSRAPCMTISTPGQPSTYSKRYPFFFQPETLLNRDGYPLYQCHDNGNLHIIHPARNGNDEVRLDNCWVVLHNPYLTCRYKAHINVEISASIKAVKYIHKYIYKGSDQVTVELENMNNEIKRYLQG